MLGMLASKGIPYSKHSDTKGFKFLLECLETTYNQHLKRSKQAHFETLDSATPYKAQTINHIKTAHSARKQGLL